MNHDPSLWLPAGPLMTKPAATHHCDLDLSKVQSVRVRGLAHLVLGGRRREFGASMDIPSILQSSETRPLRPRPSGKSARADDVLGQLICRVCHPDHRSGFGDLGSTRTVIGPLPTREGVRALLWMRRQASPCARLVEASFASICPISTR